MIRDRVHYLEIRQYIKLFCWAGYHYNHTEKYGFRLAAKD
jgi:hypothetical protein